MHCNQLLVNQLLVNQRASRLAFYLAQQYESNEDCQAFEEALEQLVDEAWQRKMALGGGTASHENLPEPARAVTDVSVLDSSGWGRLHHLADKVFTAKPETVLGELNSLLQAGVSVSLASQCHPTPLDVLLFHDSLRPVLERGAADVLPFVLNQLEEGCPVDEMLPGSADRTSSYPTLQPSTLERWLARLRADDTWEYPGPGSRARFTTLDLSKLLLEAAAAQGSQRGAEHLAAAEATGSKELVAAVRAAFPQLPSAQQPRGQRKGRTSPPPLSAVLGASASRARLGSMVLPPPGGRGALGSRVVRPAAAARACSAVAAPKGRPIVRSRSLMRHALVRLVRGWLVL